MIIAPNFSLKEIAPFSISSVQMHKNQLFLLQVHDFTKLVTLLVGCENKWIYMYNRISNIIYLRAEQVITTVWPISRPIKWCSCLFPARFWKWAVTETRRRKKKRKREIYVIKNKQTRKNLSIDDNKLIIYFIDIII